MSSDEDLSDIDEKTKVELEDQKLIEIVRQHSPLYDTNHCKYEDRRNRGKLWTEIAEKMQLTPIHCRKRWADIRSNYQRSLKRHALQQANPNRKYNRTKEFKFTKQLEFLRCNLDVEDNNSTNTTHTTTTTVRALDESLKFDKCCQTEAIDSESEDEPECIELESPEEEQAAEREEPAPEENNTQPFDAATYLEYLE